MVLMGTLPKLPERYCISLRLLYRDDRTPKGYEPLGFEAAPADGLSLAFESKPMQIDVGPGIDTGHHTVAMSVLTSAEAEEARMPAGLSRGSSGDWRVEVAKMMDGQVAGCEPGYIDEDDVEKMEQLFEHAQDLLEGCEDGICVTATWLASRLSCPAHVAELFLQKLEDDLLEPFAASLQGRVVNKSLGGSETGAESAVETESQPICAPKEQREELAVKLGSVTLSGSSKHAARTRPQSPPRSQGGKKRKQSHTEEAISSASDLVSARRPRRH